MSPVNRMEGYDNKQENYDHELQNIEYVCENVLSENDGSSEFLHLKRLFNSVLTNKCDCSRNELCNSCHEGPFYTFNTIYNEMVLKNLSENRPIFECFDSCPCEERKCENRLVQFGARGDLEVIDSCQYKSKGLISWKPIPKGGFICEYAGELLTSEEARRRFLAVDKNNGMNYILRLNEYSGNESSICSFTIIDPTYRGNIGRYLNHSCEPNCRLFSVRVDCPIPKVAIFAARDIQEGEELCFDYGSANQDGSQYSSVLCLCRAKKCRKFLPRQDL